ncbi:hypothetical protein DPMN_146488 [Dreissena polymorpha]|uniref:Uncharacterized protein n=1 Tax=Dreissena polymorpha TaxID=45954 RepID=A0A9D4FAE4_DREPO|nr:hypothetical protein DPMN_146488 [Dreissena polymorpha]
MRKRESNTPSIPKGSLIALLKHVRTLCKDFKKEILDTLKPASSKPSSSSRGRNSRSRDKDDVPLRVPGTGSHRPRPTPEW